MARDDEAKDLRELAEKAWPSSKIEVIVCGGLGQPAETVEIFKLTMFGRQVLFALRHADAVNVAERMLRALLDKEVPCQPPPPSCSGT